MAHTQIKKKEPRAAEISSPMSVVLSTVLLIEIEGTTTKCRLGNFRSHRRRKATSIRRIDILMQRQHANIIDLHHPRNLTNQELKPQIRSIRRRKELHQIIRKRPRRIIARIDRIHRLLVNLHTDETGSSSTCVKIRPEPEVVRYAAHGAEVLADSCGLGVRGGGNGPDLLELVGEVRGVAGGADGVRGARDVFGDPWREAAFEATVLDAVVEGAGGSTCGARCCGGARR